MLDRLQEMITELNESNSTNDKLEVLENYLDMSKILNYTYNPLKQYYVTSKTAIKHGKVNEEWAEKSDEDIFELLDLLNKRELSGHAALEAVNGFVKGNPEYEEIIYLILDRNLKTRANATLINKVFPNTIPEFKVQLANSFDANKVPDFENEKWFSSRKMDGCRTLAFIQDNTVKFFSRTGKEFFTLDVLKNAIMEFYDQLEGYVLDGELCIVDENDEEDFTSIMKEIRKKNHTIKNPKYKTFDIYPIEDFLNKKGETLFEDRYSHYLNFSNEHIEPLAQIPIQSEEHLSELSLEAEENEWEGLIIRKNVKYEGKRSKNMLKMKSFKDDEYEVVGIETGPFRIIENGKEIEEEMLSRVNIKHKGNIVGVGSGFSLKERREFYKNPNDIIGNIITVKYFEESKDANGNPSLRFPTVKIIHGKERTI
ncbi:MAG: RNA ligase family protein [bacterium]